MTKRAELGQYAIRVNDGVYSFVNTRVPLSWRGRKVWYIFCADTTEYCTADTSGISDTNYRVRSMKNLVLSPCTFRIHPSLAFAPPSQGLALFKYACVAVHELHQKIQTVCSLAAELLSIYLIRSHNMLHYRKHGSKQ